MPTRHFEDVPKETVLIDLMTIQYLSLVEKIVPK